MTDENKKSETTTRALVVVYMCPFVPLALLRRPEQQKIRLHSRSTRRALEDMQMYVSSAPVASALELTSFERKYANAERFEL